ncbi:MAG: hypothetical protein Q9190_000263 [Brigantiaea leucoxantha]
MDHQRKLALHVPHWSPEELKTGVSSQILDKHISFRKSFKDAASTFAATSNTQTTVRTVRETEAFINLDDDFMSQTSYASTNDSSVENAPQVPSPPEEAANVKPFGCPYCFEIITIQSDYSWRPASSVVQDQCLLCFKESVHIRNHIARHMQTLALFVLPCKDKDEREDTGSVQNNAASVASDCQGQQTGNELSEDEISAGALSNVSESAMKDVSPVPSQGSNDTAESEEADPDSRLRIVIHLKGGDIARRIALLEIGSTLNVISHREVRDIGFEIDQPVGGLIMLKGEMIKPIGLVTFEWHVADRKSIFISDFAVLEDKNAKNFDILLVKAITRQALIGSSTPVYILSYEYGHL